MLSVKNDRVQTNEIERCNFMRNSIFPNNYFCLIISSCNVLSFFLAKSVIISHLLLIVCKISHKSTKEFKLIADYFMVK